MVVIFPDSKSQIKAEADTRSRNFYGLNNYDRGGPLLCDHLLYATASRKLSMATNHGSGSNFIW